jgi:hypothetical protein
MVVNVPMKNVVGILVLNGNADFAKNGLVMNAMSLKAIPAMQTTLATPTLWQPHNCFQRTRNLVPNVLLPFTRLKDATKCGVLNATLDSVGAEGLLKTAYTTHTIMSGSDKMAVAELPEMWEILNVVETSETII